MKRLIRLENDIPTTKKLSIKQIKFPENNKIVFGQDFSWWSGIPSDRVFDIENKNMMGEEQAITDDKVWLVADGYGRKPGSDLYGNGSIVVYRKKEYTGWPITEEGFIECLEVHKEKEGCRR